MDEYSQQKPESSKNDPDEIEGRFISWI